MTFLDIPSAYLATAFGLSLSAVAAVLINFGEMREHKRNIDKKVDGNKKDIEDKVATNFKILTDGLEAHEKRDDERHKEIIKRVGDAEEHILEVFKDR